jgi:tRNA dimethylallyltransferase
MPRPRLLCITGHTASGKSSLAMGLAESVSAELLSVDSMQVWRGFDIGTAKPTKEERLRVPHHGLDLVDPDDSFSAGAFLTYARGVLTEASERGVPVIAVGGTGLYLRAMLHGLAPAPTADWALRAELRSEEADQPGAMHARLLRVDPVAAGRLHPNDLVRIERAIEVYEQTGRSIAQHQADHAFGEAPFDTWLLAIRWPRPTLVERIAARVGVMLESGWIEEVRRLVAAGVTEDRTPMKAIGYREIAAHLRGELDREELRERIVVATRRFAKRQATWFNREPCIEWVEPMHDLAERLRPRVEAFVQGRPHPGDA